MATLFDLAQQYLNRALPETFRYDRTQPPTIGPRLPVQPEEPIKKLLPVPGGNEEGFSVYNPDPNRTRTPDRYSPYNYRQAAERNLIGSGDSQFDINKYGTGFRSETEANKFMDMYPDYYTGPQLTGIPGAIQGYMKNSLAGQLLGKAASGIESLLPVNNRAILENELLGQGFQLNDIGQFVSDGGDAYKEDGSNIMAGYNAAKVTRQTFDKRREKAKKNMTPEGFEKFNKALTAAEDKFFGGSAKATTVFNDQLKQKDIDDGFINDQIPTYDEEIPSFITDDTIVSDTITGGINLNDYDGITPIGPTYGGLDSIGSGGGITFAPTAPITSGSVLADKNINKINDYIDIGGGRDRDDGPSPTPDYSNVTTAKGPPSQISTPSYGTGSGGLGDYQIQPSKPKKSLKTTKPGTGGGADSGGGGGGGGGGGKIVCTMMNETYGFGSFRNKIWLKHSKGLAPEYQKGYHKLFLPLVKIAKTNKVVRKILEHIAVHRTIDIRQESRGKVHLLGRVYRKILEPICYFVGKHG